MADGTVYIGSDDHKVYALDAATGRPRWTYKSEAPGTDSMFMAPGTFYSSPAVADGTVYVGSNDTKVYALDAATGRPRWAYTTGAYIENGSFETTTHAVSGPAVAGGTVYVGSYNHNMYALDAATGRPRWTYTTGGSVASGPAVADGTVYIGSDDHKVYALTAGS